MYFQKTELLEIEEENAYFILFCAFPTVGICVNWLWLIYEGGYLCLISRAQKFVLHTFTSREFRVFLVNQLICASSKE